MAICYSEALDLVRRQGMRLAWQDGRLAERSPLPKCINRIAGEDVESPTETPRFDNSAMDGYAVSSKLTAFASPTAPNTLRNIGEMAAGSQPLEMVNTKGEHRTVPCVEIMTGSAFPRSLSDGYDFDACVPYEQATRDELDPSLVHITRPAKEGQHRRPAGSDYAKGVRILSKGAQIDASHIMALASTGISEVMVERDLRVLVFSTGSEVSDASSMTASLSPSRVFDANGPFLNAALDGLGASVQFAGVMPDDADVLAKEIMRRSQQQRFDLVLTTGAVSAGKYDFVRESIEKLKAHVVFHHVNIRPGHPALFAMQDRSIPGRLGASHDMAQTAIFALPGNPIACAATFRFLVMPYIRALQGLPDDVGVPAKLSGSVSPAEPRSCEKYCGELHAVSSRNGRPLRDVFRHASLRVDDTGSLVVEVSREQSSSKTRPFALANCWVHVPRDREGIRDGDVLRCFTLSGKPWGVHSTLEH